MSAKTKLLSNLILFIVFSAVVCIGFFPQSDTNAYVSRVDTVYYAGNKNHNKVSFMFNVYENSDIVSRIVDVLNNYGVKATFFVGGCWADDNEDILKLLMSNGEEIGNHGYFHKDHKLLNYEKNKEEILNTDKVVTALCGADLKLFAPPSGSFSKTTLQVATELNYKVVMWTKDTIDWRDFDYQVVINRATNNISNGDLILMHPKAHTLRALPTIIETVKSAGFDIVTVSKNIGD